MKRNLQVFAILSIFCFGCHSDNVQYTWNLCGNNTINYENNSFVIDGYHNFFDGLDCAKEQNKPVLVFFYGYGCLSIRGLENHFFEDVKTQEILKKHFVPVVLYVDDRKPVSHLDMDKFSETIPMTMALNSEIKNLGNLNTAIQLELTYQMTQPLAISITHDGQLLGNTIGYEKKDLFNNWLEASLANFKADNYLFDIM